MLAILKGVMTAIRRSSEGQKTYLKSNLKQNKKMVRRDNETTCWFAITVGAFIVRQEVLRYKCLSDASKYILRTATGQVFHVYGKVTLSMQIGDMAASHTFLVADITDD